MCERAESEIIERAQAKNNAGRDQNDPAAVRERLRKRLEEKRRGNSSRTDNQGA